MAEKDEPGRVAWKKKSKNEAKMMRKKRNYHIYNFILFWNITKVMGHDWVIVIDLRQAKVRFVVEPNRQHRKLSTNNCIQIHSYFYSLACRIISNHYHQHFDMG